MADHHGVADLQDVDGGAAGGPAQVVVDEEWATRIVIVGMAAQFTVVSATEAVAAEVAGNAVVVTLAQST
ncbi:hypothetical protein [Amycolatopsis anabasis]|uniref:hypothetical protein n=1 Tax=Amycolatopsis anabasis TaxID=1840409 RepID=UPI00131C6FD6|nr:hypothetical protein [Amycolatopsis anabasis]